jgi:thioredoxin reductase
MLVRGDRLEKTMSAYLIERIRQHPLIDVHLETQLTELHPNGDAIAAVTFSDSAGKAETRPMDGVFLCIGGEPVGFVNSVVADFQGNPEAVASGTRPQLGRAADRGERFERVRERLPMISHCL